MKSHSRGMRRAAIALAAAVAASLSFAGKAQAQFTGPGVYVIRILGTESERVLDVEWNSTDLGRHLLRWGPNNGANQKFVIFASPRGGYVIRPLHSLRCLDLPGWRTEVGIQPVQYYCTGQDNQRFYIDAVPTGGHQIRSAYGNMILYAWNDGGRVQLAPPTDNRAVGMVFQFDPV